MATTTPARDTRMIRKRKATARNLGVTALAVVVIGAGGWYWRQHKARTATADVKSLYQTQAVTRGNLYVTISGSGLIEPANKAQVKSKVTGDIVRYLKSEGDFVKEGEVIAELDPTNFDNAYRQAEMSLNAARIKLEQAQKDSALFPTQAKSSVEQAKATYLSAKQRLDDLLAGPSPMDLEQQESSIRQAQASYDSALSDYSRQKSLHDQGAISKATLESSETRKVTAYEQLLSAKQKLASLTEKATPQEIASARAQLRQADASLKLAEANARINTKEDTLAQARTQYATAKANLEETRKDMAFTTVKAPISGTIWSVSAVVGDRVNDTAPFLTIVDTTSLLVRVQVDESDITSVVIGQQAKVTADASSDRSYMGKVARIAPEATTANGVATYDVIITLDSAGFTLKPGMNADVEILTDYARDAVMVPVGAVLNNNGRRTVMVMEDGEPSHRRIETGRQNDSHIQVMNGIKAGDMVVINPNVGTQSTTTTPATGGNRMGGGAMGMMGGFPGGR